MPSSIDHPSKAPISSKERALNSARNIMTAIFLSGCETPPEDRLEVGVSIAPSDLDELRRIAEEHPDKAFCLENLDTHDLICDLDNLSEGKGKGKLILEMPFTGYGEKNLFQFKNIPVGWEIYGNTVDWPIQGFEYAIPASEACRLDEADGCVLPLTNETTFYLFNPNNPNNGWE